MKTALLCLGFAVAAAACATSADCSGDWYGIGQRDGRLGATPQAELYAKRCAAAVDAEKYAEGWRSGYSQRPNPVGN